MFSGSLFVSGGLNYSRARAREAQGGPQVSVHRAPGGLTQWSGVNGGGPALLTWSVCPGEALPSLPGDLTERRVPCMPELSRVHSLAKCGLRAKASSLRVKSCGGGGQSWLLGSLLTECLGRGRILEAPDGPTM